MMCQNPFKTVRLICISLVICILFFGIPTAMASTLPDVIPIPTSPPFPPEDYPLKEYHTELIVLISYEDPAMDNWPLEKLIAVIQLMEANHRELNQDKLVLLKNTSTSDSKRKEIALDMLYEYTKWDRSICSVSPNDILVVDWGQNTTWTLGMSAWMSNIKADYKLNNPEAMGNPDASRSILPEEGDASEEEVIRHAYEVLIEIYGLTYDEILAMKQYRSFFYDRYLGQSPEEATRTWTCRFLSSECDYMVKFTHDGIYLDAARFDK